VSSKTQCTGSNRSILNYSQTTLHNIKWTIMDDYFGHRSPTAHAQRHHFGRCNRTLFGRQYTRGGAGIEIICTNKIWASKSACSRRTTNACESFHAHLIKCFNFSNPNIFVFLDIIQNYQSEIYIQIQSIHTKKNT
jgi:hypothetical protein